jgi:hypothetical protein
MLKVRRLKVNGTHTTNMKDMHIYKIQISIYNNLWEQIISLDCHVSKFRYNVNVVSGCTEVRDRRA